MKASPRPRPRSPAVVLMILVAIPSALVLPGGTAAGAEGTASPSAPSAEKPAEPAVSSDEPRPPGGAEAASPEPSKPPQRGAETAPELLLWAEIPTVVSASRREEPVSQAPNAVSIITAEDIHASGMMTLGDLLRLAVGVDVAQLDGFTHAIGVRGLHGKWSNNTLVLMDGRTIYNPIWGGVLWGGVPVMIEDIERIEVVRGPGGAAWGANAANGVINIITKKPGDTPGFLLSQTLTNRLDSITEMRYGFTAGKLDLRLSAGYDSLPEIGVREGPGNHDFVRMPRANLRSTYHFDKERSLDVDAGYVDGVTGEVAENVVLAGASYDTARWFPQSHFLRLRYTHQKAPEDFWYVQYFLNREVLTLSKGGHRIGYTQHDVEAQKVQPLGDRHVLTYGGNIRVDAYDVGDPTALYGLHGARLGNEESHCGQQGLFIQDRFQLNDQWTLIGGVRADHNSYTDWEWSGRGTLLFHPALEHTFRASVARAFRTPTLKDRCLDILQVPTGLPPPFPQYFVQVLGDKDLNASYLNAYEFGYTYEKKDLRLNAEFFFNDYRGVMAGATVTPPLVVPQVALFENIIDGHLYGFELSGQYRVTKQVRVDASYVWENWIQSSDRAATTLLRADTALPPQQKVGAGVSWEPLKDLIFNGRMWWVDKVETLDAHIKPYARFDFNAIKRFGKNCEVAVGVQNAFDTRHMEMTTSGSTPVEVGERTWYVRFQASF